MKTPHWPPVLGYKPIDLGLERVKKLLNRLGNPENKLPPVVHVAGTNGKGSTIAYLRAILEMSGYKVHAYTSPHLVEFNERIILSGSKIEDGYLTDILEECKSASDGIKITFFEGTTVAAFLGFSREPADIVLLETGMGGRLDATNIIEKPELTIITPISFDHMEFLGSTIDEIAGEKAAIMKKNVPCVVGKQPFAASEIIKKTAEEQGAPMFLYGEDWEIKKSENSFNLLSGGKKLNLPIPNLEGEHQIYNAGTAAMAALQLRGFLLKDENIKKGIISANWPGRLQKINIKNMPGNCEIFIDGGHNESAASILAKKAREWVKEKPLYLIIGMMKDKEIEKFISAFPETIKFIYSVNVPGEKRGKSGNEINRCAKNLGFKSQFSESVNCAINDIVKREKKPFRILICGSLYLVGTILAENYK